MNAIEFFSGLGGWRLALGERGKVLAAFDISEPANATYALNFGDAPRTRELATIPWEELESLRADTWLMSPPCQPFCRMGKHQDLADPRSQAFLRLMALLPRLRPLRLVLENVEGFLGSQAHDLLCERLHGLGLHWREQSLCPTELGIPNQRPRVYLVATAGPIPEREIPRRPVVSLEAFLDMEEDPALYLPASILERHGPGMDIVAATDHRSACFIGGYGRRWVGSGSFLRTPGGVRRFSPAEIARLLGYPDSFRFPEGLGLEKKYKLLGNSLSLPAARWVLGHL